MQKTPQFKPSFSTSFRANILKNLSLLKASKILLATQLILHIGLLITGGLVVPPTTKHDPDLQQTVPPGDVGLRVGRPSIYWIPTPDSGYSINMELFVRPFVYVESAGSSSVSALLRSVLRFQSISIRENSTFFPVFEKIQTNDMGAYLRDAADRLSDSCLPNTDYRSNCSWTFPRLGINFNRFDETNLQYTLEPVQTIFPDSFSTFRSQGRLINSIDSALWRILTNQSLPDNQAPCSIFADWYNSNDTYCPTPHLRTYGGELTANRLDDNARAIVQATALIFSLTTFITVIIYRLVTEKSSGLAATMRQSGMGSVSYWLSNFVTDLATYVFILILHLIGAALLGYDPILRPTSSVFAALWLFPLGLIPFAYAVSLMFSSAVRALGLCYILTTAIMSTGVASNIFLFKSVESITFWYNLLPPLAALRVMILGSIYSEITGLDMPIYRNAMSESFSLLIGSGISLFVLTIWLDSFLPKVGQGWNSPFSLCRSNRCCNKASHRLHDEELDQVDPANDEALDEGVASEISGVQNGEFIQNGSPLVVVSVSKNWNHASENKHIEKISFHLEQNGVFCLIGSNGSGKSTLLQIMAGKESNFSGDVLVLGSSAKKDPTLAWKTVGICNQTDSFWDQLNVEEHLLLYIRLKGVPRSMESEMVTSILSEVGLSGERYAMAVTLSGGQKRRLSIALALCSDPAVLLLDEPLAGLDPVSRRDLFDFIRSLGKTRSVLVATHFMKEAEKYADKVGLLVDGRLKCLGAPDHIKARYGGSSKVIIQAPADCHSWIIQLLKQAAPQLKPSEDVHQNQRDELSFLRGQQDRSKIYETIEKEKSSLGIVSWRFQEASLEDVFVNLTRGSTSGDMEHISLE